MESIITIGGCTRWRLTCDIGTYVKGLLIFVSVSILAVITRYYVVSALRASDVEVSALGYIEFLRVRDWQL